jgi:hypothetical protein
MKNYGSKLELHRYEHNVAQNLDINFFFFFFLNVSMASKDYKINALPIYL